MSLEKILTSLFFCLCTTYATAQVGINTVDPKAQLDITSTDRLAPRITDGILIPRITNFPASQPGQDQDGMLVFLNFAKPNFPIGFYFWNNSETRWSPITDNAFSNFYKEGTEEPSKNIDDAIYRNGNIRIGGVANEEVKLAITIDPDETAVKAGLEIENTNSANTRVTYSINADNSSKTGATKYGIKNSVSADGGGIHYGIHNKVYQMENSDIYGIYNSVGKTFGAGQEHFGIYSEIGTTQGNGTIYGIYSKAEGTDDVYAGFFEGKVAIGDPATGFYVLPETIGAEDQVLITDKAGKLSWKYPNEKKYISTGSTVTGAYVIPEEAFTVRIYDNVTSVTIPDASSNEGRILILLNWYGNSTKNFNFLNGDEIYDVTVCESCPTITSIDGGKRMVIQSIGTRWILLNSL